MSFLVIVNRHLLHILMVGPGAKVCPRHFALVVLISLCTLPISFWFVLLTEHRLCTTFLFLTATHLSLWYMFAHELFLSVWTVLNGSINFNSCTLSCP